MEIISPAGPLMALLITSLLIPLIIVIIIVYQLFTQTRLLREIKNELVKRNDKL